MTTSRQNCSSKLQKSTGPFPPKFRPRTVGDYQQESQKLFAIHRMRHAHSVIATGVLDSTTQKGAEALHLDRQGQRHSRKGHQDSRCLNGARIQGALHQ